MRDEGLLIMAWASEQITGRRKEVEDEKERKSALTVALSRRVRRRSEW